MDCIKGKYLIHWRMGCIKGEEYDRLEDELC